MPRVKFFSKIGWLLVIIGFFMPISCKQNGVKLAKYMFNEDYFGYGVCMVAVLVVAIIALLGVFSLLVSGDSVNDFVFLIPNVVCGLVPYFKFLDEVELEEGGIMIIIGWSIVLIGSIVAAFTRNYGGPEVSAYDTSPGNSYQSSTMLDRLSGTVDTSIQYWTCRSCGCATNPMSSTTCKDCGEYK